MCVCVCVCVCVCDCVHACVCEWGRVRRGGGGKVGVCVCKHSFAIKWVENLVQLLKQTRVPFHNTCLLNGC